MMSRSIQSSALPSVMEAKLRAIRRRQAALAVIRAVAIGVAVLLAAMLAAMIVDWAFTLFHTGVRVALTAAVLVLTGISLLATGVRPLMAALGWTRAATTADEAAPQLEERWTTVASFAVSNHRPSSPTAQAMLEQVTREAAAMGRLVQPRQAVTPAALRPALLAFAGSAAALAMFVALVWPQSSVLLRRFWSPFTEITATQLRSVTGDVQIPRGEPLDLVTELTGVSRQAATLTVEHDSGVVDVFALEPADDQPDHFIHAMRVADSFRYQVRAGDGQTAWHRVTAIDYPELAEVRFTVTAPAYVDRPSLEKTRIPRRVKVVQGSQLELRMKPLAEVERLELVFTSADETEESAERILALTPDANGWYRYETQLLEDLSFRPSLINVYGLTNEDKPLCSIEVVSDKAPVARILSPTEEMAVTADEELEIKFEAHDDHGVAAAELVVYDESEMDEEGEPKIVDVQEVPLGDQQFARYVTASARLDLKRLSLEPGANLSYAIRVTDNRRATINPQARKMLVAEANSAERQDELKEPATGEGNKLPTDRGKVRPSEVIPTLASADRQEIDARTDDNGKNAQSMLAAADRPGNLDTFPAEPIRDETISRPRNTDARQEPPVSSPGMQESAQSPRQNVAIDAGQNTDENGPKSSTDANRDDDGTEDEPQAHNTPAGDSDNAPPSEKPTLRGPADENKGVANPRATGPSKENPPADHLESAVGDPDARPDNSPTPNEPADEEASEGNRDIAIAASPAPGDAERKTASDGPTMPQGAEGAASSDEGLKESSGKTSDKARPQENASRAAPSGNGSSSDSSPPSRPMAMNPQSSMSGQNAETGRRRLKITERLTAVAAAEDVTAATLEIRERVAQIDKMLAAIEADLTRVVNRELPDASHSRQFQALDTQLGEVEEYIAQLHRETKDHEFAFVGLQMVDISRSHVTPARDRVFVAARDSARAAAHASDALQHVVRARELLAALLERYDRAARERELAQSLEETVTMYEVYVEKMQQLMREARQSTNPLQRKMAVIEVDQEYLDRYAEVLSLRREMLAEFGRMLADDPRLLARYLDLIKRRRASLRDQLSELAQRQEEIGTELSGWLLADESQRQDLWTILIEMRLPATTLLAKDAAELAERIEKQMPLVLEPSQGAAATVIGRAKEIARSARSISFDAPQLLQAGGGPESGTTPTSAAERLVAQFSQLEAALDQLNFEHEAEEEVAGYVAGRLLEGRTVADQAAAWASVARFLQEKKYAGLAEVDQDKLSIATELLRVEMLGVEDDLEAQFQQQTETGVPAEIVSLVRELHYVMEAVVFNQAAATFALTQAKLDEAELQQSKALEGFSRAEELLDKIRREVAKALDEYDEPDPSIADLLDPTLDEFLAQLEREPNIEAQLGIPNRPRNLRVIADTLLWRQTGDEMLGGSGEAAMQRAREAMKMRPARRGEQPPQREPTPQQREQIAKDKALQDQLAKSLAAIEEKSKDPKTSPQERRKLEQMAESMRRTLEQVGQPSPDAKAWEELAKADQAREILQALARGEPIPDQQWNKLLSTLEDGLWQVRGKTPPADYRKAIEQYQDHIRRLMNTEE